MIAPMSDLRQPQVIVAFEGFSALLCIPIAELSTCSDTPTMELVDVPGNVLDVAISDKAVLVSYDNLHQPGSTTISRPDEVCLLLYIKPSIAQLMVSTRHRRPDFVLSSCPQTTISGYIEARALRASFVVLKRQYKPPSTASLFRSFSTALGI